MRAKERKRALLRKNRKQPGLKQPGLKLGTAKTNCNFSTATPFGHTHIIWVDVSDIFYFFLLGGGAGGVRGAEREWGEVGFY